MSKDSSFSQFFFKVADLGITLQQETLYLNALRILKAIPIDLNISNVLNTNLHSTITSLAGDESLTRFRYTLEAIYSMLFPANKSSLESTYEFQCDFILNGSALQVLDFITHRSAFTRFDLLSKV
jgi:translation elongation factor EF-4